MADRSGQQLGNYRLLSLLGQGGFAEVYLGEHIFLKKSVAIKLLYTQLGQADMTSFLKEAQTIAHLEHPHIVRVTDFGLDNNLPYLVMEYAPNGTLRTRHPRDTILPLATISSYVKQVANALQYAHDEKLVHRDIKPENMLLNRNNDILLSDFGLATVAHHTATQNTQSIAGTAVYMAPELFRGKSYPASDQYALAVVVYEWLCGKPPFYEGDFIQLGYQHTHVPPEPLSEKMPELPQDVEHVVSTALAKDPKQRFGSVKAFANALEQACMAGMTVGPQKVTQKESAIEIASIPMLSEQAVVLDNPVHLQQKQPQLLTEYMSPESTSVVSTQNSLQQVKTGSIVENSPPVLVQPKHSRRAVLIGLGIAGAAVVGGGITWFVVSPKLGSLLYTYRGHSNIVITVAWLPNGQRIASGSDDKTVQVWNASDGSNVFTYKWQSGPVSTVAWSPDGKHIVSGSDDAIQIWNAADGSYILTYSGHSGTVWSVAWSPDGMRIVSGSDDKTVQVWNAMDGSHVFIYKGHSSIVWSVAWSPDGMRIASSSGDGTVQVWNAVDGSHAFTYHGHKGSVNVVAWSPDGKRIASGSDDKTVQVWNATDGSQVFTYKGHSDAVNAIRWSPDGKRIASGSNDKTVQVWNATDGSQVFTYKGHSDYVDAVAWSPDGKRIASGSGDKTVQVWQAV